MPRFTVPEQMENIPVPVELSAFDWTLVVNALWYYHMRDTLEQSYKEETDIVRNNIVNQVKEYI